MPSNAPLATATPGQRDQLLDGFRGLAVPEVLFGHAVSFRYARNIEAFGKPGQLLTRLAGPPAAGNVSLFFASVAYHRHSSAARRSPKRHRHRPI